MSDEHHEPLPPGVYAGAMDRHLALTRQRVEARFNRARAVFAESLVAELLGAECSLDPAAAWDLTWKPEGRVVRLEVKCSGERLPRRPDRSVPASWDFPIPKSAYDPDPADGVSHVLGPGRHFDVLILARHSGIVIEAGWSFHLIPVGRITGRTRDTRVGEKHLASLGAVSATPETLAEELRQLVDGQR